MKFQKSYWYLNIIIIIIILFSNSTGSLIPEISFKLYQLNEKNLHSYYAN